MNGLARFVACSIFLVCSTSAIADTLSVNGYVSFDQTNAYFSAPYMSTADSGYFAAFSDGSAQYLLGTVAYMDGVLGGTQETFTFTDANGDVLAYYNQHNSPSQSMVNGDLVVTLDETGYYTVNGGPEEAGFLDVVLNGTSATGAASNVQFFATGGLDTPTVLPANVAPEPASILLMGTGLMSAAMFLRKRGRRGMTQSL